MSRKVVAKYFNPRAPCGARRRSLGHISSRLLFQPTRPLRGATVWCRSCHVLCQDFNPRAPCGARRAFTRPLRNSEKFQPTRPLRGATSKWYGYSFYDEFQPTRPLRGATILDRCQYRTGSKFQPTRPLRGATYTTFAADTSYRISTHAPLAGRDTVHGYDAMLKAISTHAPLAGRDCYPLCSPNGLQISTHAPLAGRDVPQRADPRQSQDFNPRAPCGARQQKCTNHYAHFCDNRQISDAFAQNAACQGILLLFDAGKSCGFWVRTAQVISAHLCFAL